jgi:RNA polymerase sigma-70 factor (ECF subfamily)
MAFSFFRKNIIAVNSEEELINLAKKDSRYFAPIYKRYHEQIFRFIYQRMDCIDDADDITSQVFLKALVHLPKYINKGFPFSSWLYKIALNEVNMFYRKTKKQRAINVEENEIKEIIEEANENYSDENREKLLQLLAQLEEDKLTLIEMRFFEKRSFKEISELLGITENNAKVKTYRLLEEMKKNML